VIPPEVYQSRDEGRLVLFCGAGVSVNAGCPTFDKLANAVASEFDKVDLLEDSAFDGNQFDRYLQYVEQRVDKASAPYAQSRSSARVREFVAKQVSQHQPEVPLHEALLKLARDHEGRTRLVTTNYDRHFATAAVNLTLGDFKCDFAPRLARPVRDSWNSVVYLHGAVDGGDLRDLVLTSGDFGRAYITERWAARFVTDLFQNFDVLFLGYSAQDAVIRYLLDAFAARRHQSKNTIWAIASPNGQGIPAWLAQWRSVNVALIPYSGSNNCAGFSTAILQWAEIIANQQSRAARVRKMLECKPNTISQIDECQIQWLLGGGSGEVINHLVDASDASIKSRPSCPADWLPVFDRLGLLTVDDLKFGKSTSNYPIGRSQLVGTPTPELQLCATVGRPLSDRAQGVANWLAALALDGRGSTDGTSNSEAFVKWMQESNREAALNPQLADLIRWRFSKGRGELAPGLREAWALVLDPSVNRRLSPPMSMDECRGLEADLKAGVPAGLLGQRLLHALTPYAVFRRGSFAVRAREMYQAFRTSLPLSEQASDAATWQPQRHDHAWPDIVLRCGDGEAEVLMRALHASKVRDALLKGVAAGVNTLLERALDLLAYTQPAFDYGEPKQCQQVGQLDDESRLYAWTLLADLTWHAAAELDRDGDRRARALYEAWLAGRHVTQRRLALHAAAKWTNLSTEQRVEALDDSASDWLMHDALKGEVLESLLRLKQDSVVLSDRFEARREQLEQYFAARTSTTDSDEGVRFIAPSNPVDISQMSTERLAELMLHSTDITTRDGRTGGALEVLVPRGGSKRLLDAVNLAVTRYKPQPPESIACGRVVDAFPDRAARYVLDIAEHAHKSEETTQVSEDEILATWDALELIAMSVASGGIDDSSREELTKALNHPAGKLAQALFAILLPPTVQRRTPLDERLKTRIERNLVGVSDGARAFLAIASSRLGILHFAEPEWTARTLVPHFDWKDRIRARASWQGFLWAPSLDQELYGQLRTAFLDTFRHAEDLAEFGESLSGLLVSLAIDGGDTLQERDTRGVFRDMPLAMRSTTVWLLGKRLEEAESGAAELARHHILPWMRKWPADAEVWSGFDLADRLTSLALRCGAAFGDAASFIVSQPHVKLGPHQFSLHRLLYDHDDLFKSGSPDIARLFDHVLPDKEEHLRLGGIVWRQSDLQALITRLREAEPQVESMPEFKRLEARQ
jgi:hypothetical protein